MSLTLAALMGGGSYQGDAAVQYNSTFGRVIRCAPSVPRGFRLPDATKHSVGFSVVVVTEVGSASYMILQTNDATQVAGTSVLNFTDNATHAFFEAGEVAICRLVNNSTANGTWVVEPKTLTGLSPAYDNRGAVANLRAERETLADTYCSLWALTNCADDADVLYSRQDFRDYRDNLIKLSSDDALIYRSIAEVGISSQPASDVDFLSLISTHFADSNLCTVYKLTNCDDATDYLLTTQVAWADDVGKAVQLDIDASDLFRVVSVATSITEAIDTRDLRASIQDTYADCESVPTPCVEAVVAYATNCSASITPEQVQAVVSSATFCPTIARGSQGLASWDYRYANGFDVNGLHVMDQGTVSGNNSSWLKTYTDGIEKRSYSTVDWTGPYTTTFIDAVVGFESNSSSQVRLSVFFNEGIDSGSFFTSEWVALPTSYDCTVFPLLFNIETVCEGIWGSMAAGGSAVVTCV